MLKKILIRGVCPLILVGTMDAEPVLLSDTQMKMRCLPPLYMPPLDMTDPQDRNTWVEHCAGFDIELVRHGIFKQHSQLAFGNIPAWTLEAVGEGVIGLASRLFEVATVAALMRGAPCIEWEDLVAAVDTYALPLRLTDDNPFRREPAKLRKRAAKRRRASA